MATIKYEPFHPLWDEKKTKQVIRAYIDIYAEAPWHEWKKCSICGKYWGKKDRKFLSLNNFTHCGVKLEPYWEEHVIKESFLKAMNSKGSAYIALDGNQVVGFCYGYQTIVSKLEEKLKIKIPIDSLGINSNTLVAYQSDLAVLPKYRGIYQNQKIAKELVKLRLADFLKKGSFYAFVRTRKSPEPSRTYIHYLRLGYKVVAYYPGGDGRVVMFRQLDNLLL